MLHQNTDLILLHEDNTAPANIICSDNICMLSSVAAKLFNALERKHSKENANTAAAWRSAHECCGYDRRLQNPNTQCKHLRAMLSDGTRRRGTRRCMDTIRRITVGSLNSASLGKTDDALVSERISVSEEVVLFQPCFLHQHLSDELFYFCGTFCAHSLLFRKKKKF